jgi:quinoprotein glucose dehydrogenase
MDWVMGLAPVPRVQGLPIIKPPWGRITAIDLKTGDHAWMIPNGRTPDAIRENPALQGVSIPETGIAARPLLLVTRTLLFAAEGWGGRPILRAIDKRTGETIHEIELPGMVGSQPMTYMHLGRQYILFWVGDPRSELPARLLALALPS